MFYTDLSIFHVKKWKRKGLEGTEKSTSMKEQNLEDKVNE